MPSRIARFAWCAAIFYCAMNSADARERADDYSQLVKSFSQPDSEVEIVNNFVLNSRSTSRKNNTEYVTVEHAQIFARLLTPLNSSLSQSGDVVKAMVTGSATRDGKPWLEEGTILEGCVESSNKSKFASTDGAIVIRFYSARLRDRVIDLTMVVPDTDDQSLRPSHYHKVTRKQRVRGILMTATKLAVPMAIGTGGLSIGITTGAGAIIGGLLADDGKHMQGAVKGAWDGAGLSFLTPLVSKGKSVVMAEGSPLMLTLSDSVYVPTYTKPVNFSINGDLVASTERLRTSAKILNESEVEASLRRTDALVALVQRKLDQADLAAAVAALEQAETVSRDDTRVQALHAEIFKLIGTPVQAINNRAH